MFYCYFYEIALFLWQFCSWRDLIYCYCYLGGLVSGAYFIIRCSYFSHGLTSGLVYIWGLSCAGLVFVLGIGLITEVVLFLGWSLFGGWSLFWGLV